jgi:hypothetical protein
MDCTFRKQSRLNRRAGDEEVDCSFVNGDCIDRGRSSLGAVRRCRRRDFGCPGTASSRHTISVVSSSGATVGRTVTGSDGVYAFRGLHSGAYTINANGKSVVTYVGNDGMKVNWGVRPGAEPVVVAEPGATGVRVHSSAATTINDSSITDSPMQATAAEAKPERRRCRDRDDDEDRDARRHDDKDHDHDKDHDRRCPPQAAWNRRPHAPAARVPRSRGAPSLAAASTAPPASGRR